MGNPANSVLPKYTGSVSVKSRKQCELKKGLDLTFLFPIGSGQVLNTRLSNVE